MPRTVNLLSDRKLRALLAQSKPGVYADGGGLVLRLRPGRTAAWYLRYSINRRARWLPLGAARDVTLAEARAAASAGRARISKDRADPLDERRRAAEQARMEEVKRRPFRELVEQWYADEVADRLKQPEVVRRALDKRLLPLLGARPATEITAQDCARALDGIRRRYPAAANDLLRHLKAVFAYGVRRGLLAASPAATLTARHDGGGTERKRTRTLSRTELVMFFRAIRETPNFGDDNLLALRLLLALGVRKQELLAATWAEIDLDGETEDGPVWRLPAERTKTGEASDIPLSPLVVAWFRSAKQMAGGSAFVFPVRRRDRRRRLEHVGADTLNVALSRVNHGLPHFTVHDLRRTCRTGLSSLGVAPHVAEACLNHRPRGVEGVYNRFSFLDERRAALTAWSEVVAQAEEGARAPVVPFRVRQTA